MEEDERSVEVALFLETCSPRLSSKELRGSDSNRDKDKCSKSGSGSGSDSSLPRQSTHLERYRKLKEAAETEIDTEFAELDAWIQSCSNEVGY